MKCEICGEQTATMWVEVPCEHGKREKHWQAPPSARYLKHDVQLKCPGPKPIPSCEDCGPQLGYKTLAPLVANIRSDG